MSTYEPIASQTLGSAAASVTFSSIPQGYTDLVLVVQAISTSGNNDLTFRLNDDGSNTDLYSTTNLWSNGSSASSARTSNFDQAYLTYYSAVGTSVAYNSITQFQNYSNSTTFKTMLTRSNNAGTGLEAIVNLRRSTQPITSIYIFPQASTLAAGSTFSIYGIQVGDKAQKAQGGNIVTTDGTYVYHTFTSSGSFIPNSALTADYLVVAGGAGGGDDNAGGGGAGGLRSTVTATGGGGSLESALSLSAGKSYPVIVGAGGTGATINGDRGTNGSDSIFSTITSTGGGGGGGDTSGQRTGANGGSGGGGAGNSASAGGTGITGTQGYGGGTGRSANPVFLGGGGGGASAVGATAAGTQAGAGGAGVAVSISSSSVTYAGGGGGGAQSGSAGAGGSGGGGAGATSGTATAGTAFTGGGGGGGCTAGGNGGNGGSGVVIIRYLA